MTFKHPKMHRLSTYTALFFIWGSLLLGAPASAQTLRVVTTIPDLAWMANEIGQGKVEAISLLNGTQDPHYVDARPDYVTHALKADVVCIVGLGLETSWIHRVLSKTGKKHIQPGEKGYCELGKRVEALEKPIRPVDRSQGDVHPEGNPHFWLSPSKFIQASQEILNSLVLADANNASFYQEGYDRLRVKFERTVKELKQKITSAGMTEKTVRFIEYHKEFSYFAEEYGLKSELSIEEKPGVSPSAKRIATVAALARSNNVTIALAASTAPRKILTRFEELSGVHVVTLPLHVQAVGELTDYLQLQNHYIESIIKAFKLSQTAKQKTAQ